MAFNFRNLVLATTAFFFSISLIKPTDAFTLSTTTPYKILGQFGEKDSDVYSPTDVKYDSEGSMYVAEHASRFSSPSRVVIKKFASDGTFLWKLDKVGSANGEFGVSNQAYFTKIAIDHADNFYVQDRANHRIQKFNKNGNFISAVDTNTPGESQMFDVDSNFAVDSQNNLYISTQVWSYPSPAINYIKKFSPSGTFITKWDGIVTATSSFSGFIRITGLAIDKNDIVYVGHSYVPSAGYNIDYRTHNSVDIFTSSGDYIHSFGSDGTGDGQFTLIGGLTVDSNGAIYVLDTNDNNYEAPPYRVQVFSSAGTFVTKWGSYGTGVSQFKQPTALTVNPSGGITIADFGKNTITDFGTSGTFLSVKKSFTDNTVALFHPTTLAVDTFGSVYVADARNDFSEGTNYIVKKISGANTLEHVYDLGVTDPSETNIDSVSALSLDDENNLYVASEYSSSRGPQGNGKLVKKYSPDYQNPISYLTSTNQNPFSPGMLLTPASSTVYVGTGSSWPPTFAQYDANGTKVASINVYYNPKNILSVLGGNMYFGYIGDGSSDLSAVFSYPFINGSNYTPNSPLDTANLEFWNLVTDATSSPISNMGHSLSLTQPFVYYSSYDVNLSGPAVLKYDITGALAYGLALDANSNSSVKNVVLSNGLLYVLDLVKGRVLVYRESDILGLTTPPPLVVTSPVATTTPTVSTLPVVTVPSGGGGGGGGGSSGGSNSSSVQLTQTAKGEQYAQGSTQNLALVVNKGKKDLTTKDILVSVSSIKNIEKTVYRLFDKNTGTFIGSTTVVYVNKKEARTVATSSLPVCSLFEKNSCKKGVYSLVTEVSVQGDSPRVFLSDVTVTDKAIAGGNLSSGGAARVLSRGAQGKDVEVLQKYLQANTIAYASSTPTAHYGPLTEKAVQELQCLKNIICKGSPNTTGWGVLGKKTRELIAY